MSNFEKQFGDIFDQLILSLQPSDEYFAAMDEYLKHPEKYEKNPKILAEAQKIKQKLEASQKSYEESVRKHKANASVQPILSTPTTNAIKDSMKKVEQAASKILNSFGASSHYPFDAYTCKLKNGSDDFVIEVALAGFDKSDIEIETEMQVVSVNFKTDTTEPCEKIYLERGISKKRNNMKFNIPSGFDTNKISAIFVNGLLRIEISEKEVAPKTVNKVNIL